MSLFFFGDILQRRNTANVETKRNIKVRIHFHDFVASSLSATANLIFYRQPSILQRGFIPSCADPSANQMAAYLTLLPCRLHWTLRRTCTSRKIVLYKSYEWVITFNALCKKKRYIRNIIKNIVRDNSVFPKLWLWLVPMVPMQTYALARYIHLNIKHEAFAHT